MPDGHKQPVTPRKAPKQARSRELVAAVLEAAVQVLTDDGARGFTTTRVAERAGVSVGSVYQYFPNKAAILFRLQADEWRRTADLLRGVLDDAAVPPPARLRTLVHAFVRSECAEAELRLALSDAAPLYRDAPEARRAKGTDAKLLGTFVRQQLLPRTPEPARAIAADLVTTALATVGQQFSRRPRTGAEITAYADAMADMFTAYLGSLQY